jgi:hypothetical protein
VLVPSLTLETCILSGGVKHTGYNDMGPVPAVYALIFNFWLGINSRLRAAQVALANNHRATFGPCSSLDNNVSDCIKAEANELAVVLQNAEEAITEEDDSCFDVVPIGEFHSSLAISFLERLDMTHDDITVFCDELQVLSYTTLRASQFRILNGESQFVHVSMEKRLRIIFAFVNMENQTDRSFSLRLKYYRP